jgi:lipid A 3-O-deacylase
MGWVTTALATATLLGAASAQAGTFTARFENDLFYKADREYTSGQGFGWTSEPDANLLANDVARWLPWFPDGASVRGSVALDQAIFTPTDISLANPLASDRPYAAWLRTTFAVDAKSDRRLSQYALQIGVVGAWALGEEAQNFVHRLRGFQQAQGWHYQLRNEPGIVLSDQQSWRIPLLGSTDLIAHAGGVVGNVFDYADGGALVRFGWLTDDWAPARIDPAIPGTSMVSEQTGAYIFAGVEARAVARNILLDGNTFEASRHVSKFPIVGEAELGAAVTLWRVRLAYTHVFLSREYRSQADNHQYGAVSIAIRF